MSPDPQPQGPLQPEPTGGAQENLEGNTAKFLAVTAAAIAVGGAAGIFLRESGIAADIRELKEKRKPGAQAPRENLQPPSAENWRTGEFTENKVGSFMLAFTRLDRENALFVDQNGSVIGGAPVKIPEDILRQEYIVLPNGNQRKNPQYGAVFQQWLNQERARLHQEHPTVHLNLNPNREEPTLLSVRTNLPEYVHSNFFRIVKANSEEIVPDTKMSRYAYARKIMDEQNIPEGLQKLMIGVCGVESQFTEQAENSATCSGFWQISRSEAEKHGLKGVKQLPREKAKSKRKKGRLPKPVPFDHRNDFEKSTPVAVAIYKDALNRVSKDSRITKLRDIFGLSDEDLLYPTVLNYYHSGPTRTVRMVVWFTENYPPQKVEKILGKGPYGPDLYTLMTSLYIQTGKDPLFGKESRDYTIRSRAMGELFETAHAGNGDLPEFTGEYSAPAPFKEPELILAEAEENEAPVEKNPLSLSPWTVGGVSAGVVLALRHVFGKGFFTRRDFLEASGTGATALGAPFMATNMLDRFDRKDDAKDKKPVPGPRPPKAPEPPKEAPDDGQFSPYVLRDAEIKEVLAKLMPQEMNVKSLTAEEMRKLKNKVKAGLEIAAAKKLPKFETSADIPGTKGIVQLPENSLYYRLRGVGMLKNGIIENDTLFTYAYAHTEALVREITQTLNDDLRAAGFPSRFWVRPIITGLARSQKFQDILRKDNPHAARGDSPHMYGHTVDFHRRMYDVIDTEGDGKGFAFVSASDGDEFNNEYNLTAKCSYILQRIFIRLAEEGRLSPIHEGLNPILHFSDADPLAKAA